MKIILVFNKKMPVICGIYKITSPSGKIYIGQSQDIYKRCKEYTRTSVINQVNKQPKLFNSLIKYGWDQHDFEIIAKCTVDNLDELEMILISQYDSYNDGLNCNAGGSAPRGYKRNPESVNKIAESNRKRWAEKRKMGTNFLSEEHKSNIASAINGKKHSEETLQKMRKPRSEEGKKNIKNGMKPFSDERKRQTSESVTEIWVKMKESQKYNSETAKINRSERQKRGWETRRKNQELKGKK